MDWKTILTSSVIAAIISGVFAIIQQKNSTTARYVIEQREEWREKIRDLADEIFFGNTDTMKKSLIKLKTRINPYGYFYEYEQPKDTDKKSKETTNVNYYLNDGHILKIIDKLMINEDIDKNKKLLVDYLSLLIKFDWERAKIESTINKKQVFSIVLEFLALFLLIFYFSPITRSNIIYIAIFVVVYLLPYFIQMSQSSNLNIMKKTDSVSMDKCFLMQIIFYSSLIVLSVFKDNTIICWSCFICIFSEIIKMSSFDDKKKMVNDYISALNDMENIVDSQKQNNKY